MPKIYTSKELIKIIEKDGWYIINNVGSHCQFKHKEKQGKVTILHPKKEIKTGTALSILKQAGIK